MPWKVAKWFTATGSESRPLPTQPPHPETLGTADGAARRHRAHQFGEPGTGAFPGEFTRDGLAESGHFIVALRGGKNCQDCRREFVGGFGCQKVFSRRQRETAHAV